MIGEVQLQQPRVGVVHAVGGGIGVQQFFLDGPVQFGVHQVEVLFGHRAQTALPQLQHPVHAIVVRTVTSHEMRHGLHVLELQVHGGHFLTRGQLELSPAREVVRDNAQRGRGIREGAVRKDHSRLDHAQHEIRSADLECRGGLGHGRVAVDHVQPAVMLGVRVGFVAGVDHGPRARGGGRGALPNVIGALRERVAGPVGAVAQGEAAEVRRPVGVHPAGAHQDLAGHQERDEHLHQARVFGTA